jgi:hypothetical protein
MVGRDHNQAPDVVLELTRKQAEFLLRNCESNMGFALNILFAVQQGAMSRETAEKTVALNEAFREIRDKLRKQGVVSDG